MSSPPREWRVFVLTESDEALFLIGTAKTGDDHFVLKSIRWYLEFKQDMRRGRDDREEKSRRVHNLDVRKLRPDHAGAKAAEPMPSDNPNRKLPDDNPFGPAKRPEADGN
jgi:hypothetical protein